MYPVAFDTPSARDAIELVDCLLALWSPPDPPRALDLANARFAVVCDQRVRTAAINLHALRANLTQTSNREPIEWLGLMADALLARSAIDRLQSSAYELVRDGESYRRRQKPTPGDLIEPRQRRRRT